ncbi:MAG: aspartate-semialdehyde dehydrogenase [Pseudomonadota bacterium]
MTDRRTIDVSVVGATGLVGREMLRLIVERDFPVGTLRGFASERSAGSAVWFGESQLHIEALTREALLTGGPGLVLASAGKAVSGQLREWVRGTGLVVVDNSSAFRMDPEVPLVVPEVNPEAAGGHKGYIANPNCTVIPLTVVLNAIRGIAGLEEVFMATYQSVSGAGNKAMEELAAQTLGLLTEQEVETEVFPHRIAFNLIPQIGDVLDDGYTTEERKTIDETRKILGMPNLLVSCTAVRVPTFACHGEAVQVVTSKDISRDDLSRALSEQPGLTVLDAPREMVYPMPINTVEAMDVFVGRVRKHPDKPCTYDLWIVSDNLWKGAALNSLQIAERMLADGLL